MPLPEVEVEIPPPEEVLMVPPPLVLALLPPLKEPAPNWKDPIFDSEDLPNFCHLLSRCKKTQDLPSCINSQLQQADRLEMIHADAEGPIWAVKPLSRSEPIRAAERYGAGAASAANGHAAGGRTRAVKGALHSQAAGPLRNWRRDG